MSTPFPLLGLGAFILSPPGSAGDPAELLHVKFEVYNNTITCIDLRSNAQPESLLEFLERVNFGSDYILRNGHIVLAALPAVPRDAFYELSLELSEDEVSLKVITTDPFSNAINLYFADLNLAFTQQRGNSTLTVTGSVNAVLFEHTLPLQGEINDAGYLIFSAEVGLSSSIAIEDVGEFEMNKFELNANTIHMEDIQVLYTFGEESGKRYKRLLRSRNISGLNNRRC